MNYRSISEQQAESLPKISIPAITNGVWQILGPAKGYPRAFIKVTDDTGKEFVAAYKLAQAEGWASGFPGVVWTSA